MISFQIALVRVKPGSNDSLRCVDMAIQQDFIVGVPKDCVVLSKLRIYVYIYIYMYCPSRRQREATGWALQTTGDHRSLFPRTDFGLGT